VPYDHVTELLFLPIERKLTDSHYRLFSQIVYPMTGINKAVIRDRARRLVAEVQT
jgi:hypothetical protein